MNDPDWDPPTLHSPLQDKLPPDNPLPGDIPFNQALPTIISPPIDCCAKSDIYIDDKITVSLDDPMILPKAKATVLLAIHVVSHPIQPNEPIPRENIVSISKLFAECAMEETPLLQFLGRLRSLKYVASRRRSVKLLPKHISDINLALSFLHITNKGIEMNYFSFRQPTRVYRADVCPWGLGEYSPNGRAWR